MSVLLKNLPLWALDYFFADGQMNLIKCVLSLCPCQKKDVYVKYVSYLGLDELGVQMLRVKVTLRLGAYADSRIIYLLHFFLPIVLCEYLYLSIRTRQLGVFHSWWPLHPQHIFCHLWGRTDSVNNCHRSDSLTLWTFWI